MNKNKLFFNSISTLLSVQYFGWIFAFLLLVSSCVSNKKFVYLQDKGNVQSDSNGTMPVQTYAYKLQKGDILYVALSTDDEKLNKIFVPASSNLVNAQGERIVGTQFYFTGFTLTNDGELELPYLGKVKISGQTIEQAKMTIEEALRKYFKVFFLQIKVAEFKFSVMGSVGKPGQFYFQQNKVNIIEALALAGEVVPNSKRTEIQLYRQYPDGVRLYIIDLTDRSIINSPLWFIQPNDIVYVQPLNSRTIGDLSSMQTSLSVIAPLLSTLFLVLNTYILIVTLQK